MALTDEELILSIQNCSEPMESTEISSIIYRYTRIIRLKASKLKKNAEIDGDDLFQEGVLGLLEAVRQFDAGRGRFQPFAETCIANRMKNALSKSARGLTVADDFDLEQLSDNGATTEEKLILSEQSAEFTAKLSKLLSKKELSVLNLYLEGFSYKQIADRLSVPVKSVDNSLARAKQKLKNWL